MVSSPISRPWVRRWKRLAVISLGVGAGVGIVAGAIFGTVFWYGARPRLPKPWSANAIRAHYASKSLYATIDNADKKDEMARRTSPLPPGLWVEVIGSFHARLFYDLENTTAFDYTLDPPDSASVVPMERLKENGSLVDGNGLKWALAAPSSRIIRAAEENKPIVIPAHETVRIEFDAVYDIFDDVDVKRDVKKAKWENEEELKKFLNSTLLDVQSFVLLDESQRYKIELSLRYAGI